MIELHLFLESCVIFWFFFLGKLHKNYQHQRLSQSQQHRESGQTLVHRMQRVQVFPRGVVLKLQTAQTWLKHLNYMSSWDHISEEI